ncbi:hypothetical protein AVEN_185828-1 [Araneus ventricosus]|uniref:Uncharacterized protein n=1 Tax=Araneus ventricosus TaxID=182803 RepID=A0A4Y2I310_ARAVE|nr:hypothetical protein AVEN_185828-1 [Araneus ventricosus]
MAPISDSAPELQSQIQVLRSCNPGQQGSCRDREVKSFTIYDLRQNRREAERERERQVPAESLPDPQRFERANTNFDLELSSPPLSAPLLLEGRVTFPAM